VRKELRDLRSNRQVWAGYVILPVVTLGLPILLLALLPLMTGPEALRDPGLRMLLESVEGDPSLRGATVSERLARLLLRDYGLMYLLMPMILAAGSSALSIVREKEQRTLEPILATPIGDVQLLWAKLLAVMGAPLLFTLATGLVGLLVSAAASRLFVGVVIGPTAGNLVGLFVLGPVLAGAAALAGIGVSMRLTDSQAANQFVGLVIVPVALVFVALFGRPAMMSPLAGLAGAGVGIGACALLFGRALRRLRREDLLTRWR
jgi:ABC-2 type transport system permease protein